MNVDILRLVITWWNTGSWNITAPKLIDTSLVEDGVKLSSILLIDSWPRFISSFTPQLLCHPNALDEPATNLYR